MTELPGPARLMAAMDATWAPLEIVDTESWRLRRGGGGKRVSAASARGPIRDFDAALACAETSIDAMNQPRLFRLTAGDEALDAALAARGYGVVDRTVIYAAPASRLAPADPGGHAAIVSDAPLALIAEIWEEGGIGPGRLAVMARSGRTRAYLLGRMKDRGVSAAFVATDADIAMLHALEVRPSARRGGQGRNLVGAAASAALRAGAPLLALAVTEANAGARALYEGLGMAECARYHYRIAPEGVTP
ncbi:GNAT family N-acetyltransferase [Paroceanicella profunda]|uniref:GNAT family N-acetyltransferase n=1 Tax=Paroceanicella profunda TaxID=2579971 RepID=A0A5B8FUN2_9RHOB|nr:GNAT family N-acetyltransferase [Paroceanicella profunda]QDL92085.1 GNAT family N-acetyltransferase [Paroceanicella profunda]